jgi:predicted Zn-dependent protease
VERYERATALEPGVSTLWQRLGEAYEAAGKAQAAQRSYEQVLAILGRDDPAVLAAVLRTALRSGDGATAVRAAQALRPYRPGYEGFLRLGEALLLKGEPANAARELEKAVALSPASVPARAKLAEACAAVGRLDAAADQLSHLIRLEPAQPEHYRALSRLYAGSGRLDLAIAALRDGIDAAAGLPSRGQAELLEELARLYERAGLGREAERERERARAVVSR